MRIRLSILGILVGFMPACASAQAKKPVDFNRDIRPILSDACFHCHGPDKSKRKADLQLDTEEGARADLGGYFAIVPGKPEKSALVERITSKEAVRRMPPPKSGNALKPEQIDLLTRWIADGGKYQKHWSLLPPVRAALPKVKNSAWPRNPIDHFILERLEKEGLAPSPQADRITLLRRVSLDLMGLPPTPAEVDAFLADNAPDAYERVVDRLLASKRFGERMAHRWLDAARYADTNGYQTDGDRIMWRWRDWVIEAFNQNMPFNQFTIEQIAGDMLPGATLEQKIATGFNRNHRGNSEGGVIPEEYAVEYVVDRVDTTATVWLGLTAGCAKCHSHKYDPLSQKEFYGLYAYFNNVPEKGKAIKYGNSPPYIKTPTREQEVKWAWLEKRLRVAQRSWEDTLPNLEKAQLAWEKETVEEQGEIGPVGGKLRVGSHPSDLAPYWPYKQDLSQHFPLDMEAVETHFQFGLGKLKKVGELGEIVEEKRKGISFWGTGHLEDQEAGDFGFFDRFSIAAWIKPEDVKKGGIVSRMADTDRGEGYNLALEEGRIQVHLVKRWLDDAIRVVTVEKIEPGKWAHVAFTYDGSRLASGVKIFINGQPTRIKVILDDLNQSFAVKEPFRMGKAGSTYYKGLMHAVYVYNRVLSQDEVQVVGETTPISMILGLPSSSRTPVHAKKLSVYFLQEKAPYDLKRLHEKLLNAKKDLADFDDAIPTTMVMQEMPTPRDTHLLIRGEYDKKGPKIGPGLPEVFSPLPKEAPNNRLGFARWLVDRSNPLTARVTVNRFWQMFFGAGIVKSAEDFGAQGDWPSHPALLDWLAVEFMEPSFEKNAASAHPWDVKRLIKTVVTSAAYRQSSRFSQELAARDPENRLLARGPRVRLPAEMIRDQALFAAGLLTEKIGGPSIRPYQPPGLVKELHGTDDYVQDHGPDLYRRSLYVHWKRTVPPPGLTTFDAAGREACVVREARTNTPLQALYLLNEVTNMEAARVLAQRVLRQASREEERLRLAFRLALCRPPSEVEEKILHASLIRHREHYRAHPDAARKLVQVGEYPLAPETDAAELAAYTAVANTILNLDEAITKE